MGDDQAIRLGGFAVMFLVIMYLQGGRGLRPIDASLLLVPGFVLGGLPGPWSENSPTP